MKHSSLLTVPRPPRLRLATTATLITALFTAPTLWANDTFDSLKIHGYLTQAYAVSDGEQILGIPEDGTFDYRTMALQFRYSISESDTLAIQLANTRLGNSLVQDELEDIELDWAFYEKRFANDRSAIRVGRTPIPYGIYNEIRDVGTVLEFFRPPVGTYLETYSNETIDGVVASHRFGEWDTWMLEADAYVGEWDRFDASIPVRNITTSEISDAIGVQLWLGTPIEGLRLGLAAQRYDIEGTVINGRTDTVLGSIEFARDAYYVRAEIQDIGGDLDSTGTPYGLDGFYVQTGVRFGSWGLNALYESSEVFFDVGLPLVVDYDPLYEDLALSATYSWSASLVGKLEVHDATAFLIDAPEGPRIPVAEDVRYGIVSLAVSF